MITTKINKSSTAFLLFLMISAFSGCLKDEGIYEYRQLPGFYVDTVGVPVSFQVKQSVENLKISPEVFYDGPQTGFRYVWLIGTDTLSVNKDLDVPIVKNPGNYTVDLQVVNTQNGVSAFMRYSLEVLRPVPSGWIVAYENTEGRTDAALVRTREMISALTEDILELNIYSATNGQAIEGAPKSIFYLSSSLSYIYTDKGGVTVQNTDFRRVQDFAQLFLGDAPVPVPEGFWPGSFNGGLLVNEGLVYWASSGQFVGHVVLPNSDYEAAPFVYAQYGKVGGFYDQKNRRFAVVEQLTSAGSFYSNANASARFNLNNIGKDLLYLDRGFGEHPSPARDPYKYAFFKDVGGESRYLYVFNTQTPANPDVALVDISTLPEITHAKHYAVGNLGPAVFYATDAAIYNFVVDHITSTASNIKKGLELPGGETITALKLHKSHSGATNTVANDSRFLLIGTWNEALRQGKLYQVPVNVTTGDLDVAGIKSWSGFGKIRGIHYKVN